MLTQVGITSYKPGRQTRQVLSDLVKFKRELSKVNDIRNVSVFPGLGAWQNGKEVTWVTSYDTIDETGNREALRLLAQTGQRYDQEGILVLSFVTYEHKNASPFDQVTFRQALDVLTLRLVEKLLVDLGFTGWTWARDETGNTVLQIACVPTWGQNRQTHLNSIRSLLREFTLEGIRVTHRRFWVSPLVLDQSNYHEFSA